MNNRECIDQVERGYRMAQPSHISYPESKTHAKELAVAQANVYKVQFETYKISIHRFLNYLNKANRCLYRRFFNFRLC